MTAHRCEDSFGGVSSLNHFSPRPAYDHAADISVYVDRDRRGAGLVTLLLIALEERAKSIGFQKLVLAGLVANTIAIRLYQRRGFEPVGFYHEQGLLDGQWVDTIVLEKILR